MGPNSPLTVGMGQPDGMLGLVHSHTPHVEMRIVCGENKGRTARLRGWFNFAQSLSNANAVKCANMERVYHVTN